MGLFDTTTKLASAYAESKRAELETRAHRLQQDLETPESWVEGVGKSNTDRWEERKAKRQQLREYHKIRVDGGIVATLLEARSLMVFGPGGEFTSEQDVVAEWLNEALADRDQLVFDIGNDANFYGYSLGEVRETTAGDFGEVTLIEPWTTVPELDEQGTITEWEQVITRHGSEHKQTFATGDVVHFKTLKASGRDEVGMSLLGRSMDEAEAYRDGERAVRNATTMMGFPKFHVKVGREEGAVIDDNELRRIRPQFDNITELTKWITGQDVDIDVIESESFDFEGITGHNLSKLAIAFMLPVELTQIGQSGDGLGTGFPAKLRRQLFLLGARSQQRLVGDQLVQQIGRPILDEYAPADIKAQIKGPLEDVDLEFSFNDPITDMEELTSKVGAIGDDMTVNERRSMFDLPDLEDESVGESFESPGEPDDPPGGGLFADAHELQDETDFWWEDHLDAMAETAWHEETDHQLFGFSGGDMPTFVRENLREAVLGGSAIFSDIESIPGSELTDFKGFMLDSLTDDGWTISDMQDEIVSRFDVDENRAETMARSTTQNTVSEAAELGYRDRDDFEELRFRWAGPSDNRNSEVCPDIKETVPDSGLPLEDLKTLVEETATGHDLDPRGWTPHPNCRHRPIRVVD